MYHGIVSGTFSIVGLNKKSGISTIEIELNSDLLKGLKLGASVAVDGVCLTVTNIDSSKSRVSFDIIRETLNKTTLDTLSIGSKVNIERSACSGDEIGGHLISGHVDGTAKIIAIEKPENNYILTFEVSSEWNKYIFRKGYISLNGASLTVASIDKKLSRFEVHLIPETLRLTTFSEKKEGDRVNFEIDRQSQVIVDTLLDFLNDMVGSTGIDSIPSLDFVKKITNT